MVGVERKSGASLFEKGKWETAYKFQEVVVNATKFDKIDSRNLYNLQEKGTTLLFSSFLIDANVNSRPTFSYCRKAFMLEETCMLSPGCNDDDNHH